MFTLSAWLPTGDEGWGSGSKHFLVGGEGGEGGEGDETSYQQEMKGGEWDQIFQSELLPTLLTSRPLLRYPLLAVHLSILPATCTNSKEWLALRIREEATFNRS